MITGEPCPLLYSPGTIGCPCAALFAEKPKNFKTVYRIRPFMRKTHPFRMPLYTVDRQRLMMQGFDNMVPFGSAVNDKTASHKVRCLMMRAVMRKAFPVKPCEPGSFLRP